MQITIVGGGRSWRSGAVLRNTKKMRDGAYMSHRLGITHALQTGPEFECVAVGGDGGMEFITAASRGLARYPKENVGL